MANAYTTEAKNQTTKTSRIIENTPKATEVIPGRKADMAPNNNGGVSFVLDDWGLFNRFLMIGIVGGTYTHKIDHQAATSACFKLVQKLAKQNPERLVSTIVEISKDGRAAKNDPAIVALALAAATPESAELAFANLGNVCRIGTHLFTFMSIYNELGKWNALAKRSIAGWYNKRNVDSLAVQMLKYQARNNWSHRDVLRLAHIKPITPAHNAMFKFATSRTYSDELPALYHTIRRMNAGDLNTKQIVNIIQENQAISWEMVPTKYLSDVDVLCALIPNMGLTALIRKLGVLSHHKAMDATSIQNIVAEKLTNANLLHSQRVHPIMVYAAFKQYKMGRGELGAKTWHPHPKIVSALDDAFYAAFKPSENSGEKYLVGVDISGSMRGATVLGLNNVTADEIAVIMSMAAVREQEQAEIVGFNKSLVKLGISKDITIDAAMRKYQGMRWDGSSTNPGAVFEYALKNHVQYDKFVVITDNDLNSGRQPMPLLKAYREKTGVPAKLAVIATSLSRFTIADPKDAGCIDIAGFDSATPTIIANL